MQKLTGIGSVMGNLLTHFSNIKTHLNLTFQLKTVFSVVPWYIFKNFSSLKFKQNKVVIIAIQAIKNSWINVVKLSIMNYTLLQTEHSTDLPSQTHSEALSLDVLCRLSLSTCLYPTKNKFMLYFWKSITKFCLVFFLTFQEIILLF